MFLLYPSLIIIGGAETQRTLPEPERTGEGPVGWLAEDGVVGVESEDYFRQLNRGSGEGDSEAAHQRTDGEIGWQEE